MIYAGKSLNFLGVLWDSPAHHFHVPCKLSNREVDSQHVFKKNIVGIMKLRNYVEILLQGMSLVPSKLKQKN